MVDTFSSRRGGEFFTSVVDAGVDRRGQCEGDLPASEALFNARAGLVEPHGHALTDCSTVPEKSCAERVMSLAASRICSVRAPAVPRNRSSSAPAALVNGLAQTLFVIFEAHLQHARAGSKRSAERGRMFG